MSENKTTLSDDELAETLRKWVVKACKTGGRNWTLSVPVDFNRDPDMLIIELIERFEKLKTHNKKI